MKVYEIARGFLLSTSSMTNLKECSSPTIGSVVSPGFSGLLQSGSRRPEVGCTLRWKNHELSKVRLGYAETIRELEKSPKAYQYPDPPGEMTAKMKTVVRERRLSNLEAARQGTGDTIFDWIVEIIRDHGEGGGHAWDNVKLVLE